MGDERRTSRTRPVYADFVPDEALLGYGGRIGMTLAPGVKDSSSEGFLWDRDPKTDLRRLKETFCASVLVSVMGSHEYDEYGIPNLQEEARTLGFEVERVSVEDAKVPLDTEADEYEQMIRRLVGHLEQEKVVVVHCRGGLGRTGMVVASVLVVQGYPVEGAIKLVRKARKGTVQTQQQAEYVREFERKLGV